MIDALLFAARLKKLLFWIIELRMAWKLRTMKSQHKIKYGIELERFQNTRPRINHDIKWYADTWLRSELN
jgi:hypothetical protein